ncbi:DUF1810 domain-containing protein [Pseudomonas sp. gcc21]|uniref:DUF1810 domain-containing protein n=1 Tax=Pseudomonas sp. gcc21 TaxID=2726989 RepID=UPI0014519B9B|nr:DUF1810 domain-containing protein [Pseudomonas sp. gcc21]QJD58375.1 DUF1810 domain-containing protein [Pseudomonas sp. gcc21]
MNDPYRLQRFVDAQQPVYERALAELRAGNKQSHWMWFIFPQVAGLGHSDMAQRYAVCGLDEARAYLAHPTLGQRLLECCQAVLQHIGSSPRAILGSPDDMKLRSSMTLFDRAAPQCEEFRLVLDGFYDGKDDEATLHLLERIG